MPIYQVVQSERYRAVYEVEAPDESTAAEMVENGDVEDGSALSFDLVGADVIEVEWVSA